MIRDTSGDDAEALAAIYNHYVLETAVTFEEEPVSPAEMAARHAAVRSAGLPYLVAEEAGRVVGYAYAAPWRTRIGYRFSVEVSVYVAHDRGRRGIGSSLYATLFPALQARDVHAVMGGITLPNEASVALHERQGMTQVAHFREVGFKFGRWIDVGYWQRVFGEPVL